MVWVTPAPVACWAFSRRSTGTSTVIFFVAGPIIPPAYHTQHQHSIWHFRCLLGSERPEQLRDWVEITVHNAFLQWNDRVIGDGDVLRANFRAALGDVAVSDAVLVA